MEENIEVKDVQKTEYLDKNGLDMLWIKVKENTHNQVEVERNRAVAKEDSIVQQFDNLKYVPYISKEFNEYTLAKGATIKLQDLAINAGSFVRLGQVTRFNSDDSYVEITASQIAVCYNPSLNEPDKFRININSDGIWSSDNNANHVFATDGSIADLTQYAKKTDIPEVDTSDFISKTTIVDQSIKSGLSVSNRLHIVDSSSADINTTINGGRILVEDQGKTMQVGGGYLLFSGANGSTISLNSADSEISIFRDTIVGNKLALTITKSGIRMHDGDNNHVLTTNNSTIDITKYALKSVYDEKIAALEARIAALETKHTETA